MVFHVNLNGATKKKWSSINRFTTVPLYSTESAETEVYGFSAKKDGG